MTGHDKMKKAAPKGQGPKGMLPPSGRMKYAYGGLTDRMGEYEEQHIERDNDYDGSEEEAEQFAHGGMPKKKIIAAHEKAKKAMPAFEKEYGKEKGKQVAYATMMKQEKEGMADGGEAKKPAIMAIVAKLAKKPMTHDEGSEMGEPSGAGAEEETPEGEMKAHEAGQVAAVEEMMSALKKDDKEAFAASLKNFIQMCSYGEE